jgi:hypothetical protein
MAAAGPPARPAIPPFGDRRSVQALQDDVMVAPVLVLVRTEQAAVAPTAGMVVAIGRGRFGVAGSREVTGATIPAGLTVVVSWTVTRPVQVTLPVTVTPVAVTFGLTVPVQDTAGSGPPVAAG